MHKYVMYGMPCMYVCMCACMYVRTCMCVYIIMDISMDVCKCINAFSVFMGYICMYLACMRTPMYVSL